MTWPANAGTASRPGLQKAIAYAQGQNAERLIVWRANSVLVDQTFGTAAADAEVNSYHMHWNVLVLLMGCAVADGHIGSIDDPAASYITEWSADARSAITLKHLLTMSAGLKFYLDSSDPRDLASQLFYGPERADAVVRWPIESAPGRVFEYNYIVPEVLGLILERATGKPYAAYLAERLWRPIGNRDAGVWLDGPNGRAYQNAALFAHATDWLNLGILVARRGNWNGVQLVPEAWIKAMTTASPTNPNFGFVWLGSPHNERRHFSSRIGYYSYASEPYTAEDVVIFDGYVHRVYIIPSRDIVVAYIGQSGRVGQERRARWDDALIPNAVLDGFST
ncbi:MAG: serine hydrolase [Rhodospirillaceae bacterium]|nr:serine hydrolase [Rhodospirillaceae bacterium]